jgi:hypothetical protein
MVQTDFKIIYILIGKWTGLNNVITTSQRHTNHMLTHVRLIFFSINEHL